MNTMMTITMIVGGLLVIGGIGAAAIFVLNMGKGEGAVQSRLEEYAGRSGPAITLEDIELSLPFSQRVLRPLLTGMSKFISRFTPQKTMESAAHKLELAGKPYNWGPTEFMGLRGVMAVLLAGFGLFVAFMTKKSFLMHLVYPLVGGALGFMLPALWLGSKIKKRQDDIVKSLPDCLDLLTICVEAGLGFDAAMGKVAGKWDNELSNGFGRVIRDIQFGKPRREALRDMDANMEVPDITSFIAAVIQAEQLGVSIAKVLRIQSEQMRIKRRQRAEEKAHQAPVKMLIPMVFLIFPTIFIILLGPAVFVIKDSGVMGAMSAAQ